MGILAGLFVGAALLLAVGGAFKTWRPQPTARALTFSGLGVLAPLARPLGLIEVAAAGAALATTSRLAAGLMAAFYAAFAGFVALRLRHGGAGAGGCGCFGEWEGAPAAVHVVLNLGAATVCAAVAAGPGGGLSTALRDQPLAGVPLLALAVLLTGLAYAVLTVLPRTLAELEAVRQ